MKTRRHFGRLMSSGRCPMRSLTADMVEQLPLGNPGGADTRAVGLELPVNVVKFSYEHLGPLIQLELGKTLREDRLHLIEWMGLEQIQHHRIADHELAVDRFRLPRQALGDDAE